MPEPVANRPDELTDRDDIGVGVSIVRWIEYWIVFKFMIVTVGARVDANKSRVNSSESAL